MRAKEKPRTPTKNPRLINESNEAFNSMRNKMTLAAHEVKNRIVKTIRAATTNPKNLWFRVERVVYLAVLATIPIAVHIQDVTINL